MKIKNSLVLFYFLILFCSLAASQTSDQQVLLEQGKDGSFIITSMKIEAQNIGGLLSVKIRIPFEKWQQLKDGDKKIKIISLSQGLPANVLDWEYNTPLEIGDSVAKIESALGVFKIAPNTSLQMIVQKPLKDNESGNIQFTMKSGGMSCYFGDGNFFNIVQSYNARSMWRLTSKNIDTQNIFGNSSEFAGAPSGNHGGIYHPPVNPTPGPHIPISRK